MLSKDRQSRGALVQYYMMNQILVFLLDQWRVLKLKYLLNVRLTFQRTAVTVRSSRRNYTLQPRDSF